MKHVSPAVQRKINRRHVLGGALVSAHAKILHGNVTTAQVATPTAWSPEQGLRLARPIGSGVMLDPARNLDLSSAFVMRQVFRGLTSLDLALIPVPELGEEIEVLEGGQRYRFRLRSSARFHDGKPIEASAVRASITRSLLPTMAGVTDPSALAGPRFMGDIRGAADVTSGDAAAFEGVLVIDRQTLEIELAAPSATFLMRLASESAAIVDVTQVIRSDWGTALHGSGPYRVTGYVPGESLQLTASDHWWAGRPKVVSVDIRIGARASQPTNLYQSGEIDLVDNVPASEAALLKDPATQFDAGTEWTTPLFAVSYIAFGNTRPPLGDPHIRRGLRLVFPSVRFVEGAMNGAGIAAKGLVPDGMLGTSWPAGDHLPDVSAARAEIAKSRYRGGSAMPPITIHAGDTSSAEALASIAAQALDLRIDVVAVGWPDFFVGLEERRFNRTHCTGSRLS